MVQWLARLPGTQEIRGSSPGRGMTDFVRQYSFVYINACIVQLFLLYNLKIEDFSLVQTVHF